jgi:predicted CXXCH cytochrome family protein
VTSRVRKLAAACCGGLTAALLAVSASIPSAQDKPAPTGLSGKQLLVAYTTELNGYLTPCGCSSPMIGGIPRRSTWLNSLAATDALVKLDNGDITQALGRQDELKAETIVEMMNGLGVSAINVGEKDFRLGVAYLASLQARFKGTLLCANVLKADGSPLLAESVTVERMVDGKPVKIAVAGVLCVQNEQPLVTLNPDLKVQPAEEALKRVEPKLAAANVRVLLFHGPKAEAVSLAQAFPTFQLVVCAHEGDHPIEPEKVGSTMVVCSGQDGKYGERVSFDPAGWKVNEVKSAPLGPEFADDPKMLEIKQTYLDRVNAEDLLTKVPKLALADGEKFAGSSACAPCHQEDHKIWEKSGHSHALQTLVKVKHDRDPECVQCHVVGLDKQTGFVSAEKSSPLSNVGCESCHGPASKHSTDPAKFKMKKAGSESCIGCHNPENSPGFDFAKYWPKVKH